MDNRIKEIAIVGGGTAGWLTAVYLDRALNRAPGKTCTITLIESREIGIIGVGESTIPSMRPLFQLLGFEEDDWMRACNATFKLGVKYVHWSGSRSDLEEAVSNRLSREHPRVPRGREHIIAPCEPRRQRR